VFDHYAVPDELGVLSFAYVTVNGVKYTVWLQRRVIQPLTFNL
jgi:hypothetical protein